MTPATATLRREADAREVFDRYIAAWVARDVQRIITMHSQDTTFWMHDGTERVHGRAAVEAHFAGIFQAYPDFDFDTYRTLFGERHWVLDYAMKAKMTDGAGARFDVRIDMIDVVDIDDEGQVIRKDTFYDVAQSKAVLARLTQA